MSVGKITQIRGVVIDAQFDEKNVPGIFNALTVDFNGEIITFETEQHLGRGIVRAISMGPTDGLKRGMEIKDTGAAISVPVGAGTLGRITNVLGNPVDEAGEIKCEQKWPIHRPAPKYEELSITNEILETGIKVVDLIAPIVKGGKVGLFGGAGV